MNNTSLKEFLEKYGQINFCSIISANINKPESVPNTDDLISESTEAEKIGLVMFEDKEDAIAVMRDLNGKIIDSNLKPLIITLYNKY